MTKKRGASQPHPPAPDAAPARYRVRARISVAGVGYAPGDVVDGAALPHLDAHLALGEVEAVDVDVQEEAHDAA